MGVLDELRAGQGDLGVGDAGFADARHLQVGGEGGVGVSLGAALQLQAELGLEAQGGAIGGLEGEVTVTGLSSASETKSNPEPSTVEAVEVRVQSVGLRVNSRRST